LEYLSQIPDPRGRQGRRFPLPAMLATVVCAVLTGAQGFEAIADWIHAQPREVWWRLGFFRRPPTANAFRYLLMKLRPEQLEAVVSRWVTEVLGQPAAGRLQAVALDGKSLCGVLVGHERTLHLMALLDHESGGVLRQTAVPSHTNEIGAAPQLLSEVPLQGRVVTADALLCQRELSRQIIDSGGHFLLVVKKNQPELKAAIEAEFQPAFSPGG
jgi:hypothetical protein